MEETGILFHLQKFSTNDGPGIRTTVFFKGCPLRCGWCANPESQGTMTELLWGEVQGKEYSVSQVVDFCLRDRVFYENSGGGVTLSGGEPLFQPDFALALLAQLKARKLHTALETTGFAPPDVFSAALPFTDLFLFDCKHYNSRIHQKGTGRPNEIILQNLGAALKSSSQVLVRIPVIPGFNDSPEDAREFCRLFRGLSVSRVQLLPFHQFGERKYEGLSRPYAFSGIPGLHPEALEGYREIFRSNEIDCFF